MIIWQNDFVSWSHLLKQKSCYREAECYQNIHEQQSHNEISSYSVINVCLKDSEDTPWTTTWVLERSLTVPIIDTQFGPHYLYHRGHLTQAGAPRGPQSTSWITLVLDAYPCSLVGLVWLG